MGPGQVTVTFQAMTERLVLPIVPVPAGSDVTTRVEDFTQDADLSWVVELLGERREEILTRWIEAAADQPFHRARSERAVADHIPSLYDALGRLLTRNSARSENAGVPLEDAGVLDAAQSHARMRLEQGFVAPDVATEFRLLRQEIGRALRRYVSDRSPTKDVLGAELLLHDALDGAVSLALAAIGEHEIARREAEAALERERLTVATEREAFFTTLGHDLKSPITSAFGTVQLLRNRAKKGRLDPEQLASGLSSIEAALRRGTLRIDELMDLARGDGTDQNVRRRGTVDLVALVTEVLDRYRPTTERHEFVLQASIGALAIECDADRIERAVDNLVINAVKYSPRGGRITASVSEETSGGACEAVVRVTDAGLGIPEDEREVIFARFHRGSNASEVSGSGVGLWSVRRIADQHGGSLEVESRVGLGSTFTLRLLVVAPAT